jgi:hypothetical protein
LLESLATWSEEFMVLQVPQAVLPLPQLLSLTRKQLMLLLVHRLLLPQLQLTPIMMSQLRRDDALPAIVVPRCSRVFMGEVVTVQEIRVVLEWKRRG